MAKISKASTGNNEKLREIIATYAVTPQIVADLTGYTVSMVHDWINDLRPMPDRAARLLLLEMRLTTPKFSRIPRPID